MNIETAIIRAADLLSSTLETRATPAGTGVAHLIQNGTDRSASGLRGVGVGDEPVELRLKQRDLRLDLRDGVPVRVRGRAAPEGVGALE